MQAVPIRIPFLLVYSTLCSNFVKLSVRIGSTEMELNGDATNGRIPYDFNVLLEHDFKLYAIQICNVVNWGRLRSPM